MFNKELFEYDELNHIGYYQGEIVPSVTQLLDLLFPIDKDIPADRIQKAAERGTEIHDRIAQVNEVFRDCTDKEYEDLLKDTIKYAIKSGMQELIDYVSLIKAYKLIPYESEKMVFLLDENQDLICYGTLDFIAKSKESITFNEDTLFEEGDYYLFDFKTTSLFATEKTSWQTMAYSIAYKQAYNLPINKTFGIWLRDGVKIMPLHSLDPQQTINTFKRLRTAFDIRRKKEN